ncbi:MAG TPA: DUF6152 family protein, partial [Gammaproteobacteria bacterium]|nr:DUF6152 family protein [Gammaproteobacteria bacterium]
MRSSSIAASFVLSCLSPAVLAHHSVSAWFDTLGMTEIEGEVTQFKWQNPHVRFTLRVTDADGR